MFLGVLGGNSPRRAGAGAVIRRRAVTRVGVKEFPRNSGGKASPPYGGDSGMTMVWVLLPFVLRAIAGACVGRWTGQPRMPPRERQHEGFGGGGGFFCGWTGSCCGSMC